jgi:hypothetical protein
VIERLIRTLKDECTRRLVVPFRSATFQRELSLDVAWHNGARPHEALWARTRDEVYFGRSPACQAPRFETRRRWPRRARCAAPQAPVRGRPGVRLQLGVRFVAGRRHLPVVELRRVA